jgi:putative transposase
MRSSKFTDSQKIMILKEVEVGATAVEVCRWHGISEQTFYRWRSKLGGLEPSDAKRLREVEAENARLKKMVAELMLDKAALQELVTGKW